MVLEALARSLAGSQVVADQVAVIHFGPGSRSKSGELRSGPGHREESRCALIQNHLHDNVNYAVKNGVVTLSGDVNSEHRRTGAEKVASTVPNVRQVVNALRAVKHNKSSSAQ